MIELDHVLLAVSDVHAAAAELEARTGLASVDGGRHPAWGTANRIVPLGNVFLELVGVVDEAQAAAAAFGSWVARGRPEHGARPLGWAVRTDELDRVARRLSLDVHAGSRETATGDTLRWRSAGIEQSAVEPWLPFFVEWAPGTPFPGRASAGPRAGTVEVARLELAGEEDRLAAWLGDHELPLVVLPGLGGVERVVLEELGREIILASRPS